MFCDIIIKNSEAKNRLRSQKKGFSFHKGVKEKPFFYNTQRTVMTKMKGFDNDHEVNQHVRYP